MFCGGATGSPLLVSGRFAGSSKGASCGGTCRSCIAEPAAAGSVGNPGTVGSPGPGTGAGSSAKAQCATVVAWWRSNGSSAGGAGSAGGGGAGASAGGGASGGGRASTAAGSAGRRPGGGAGGGGGAGAPGSAGAGSAGQAGSAGGGDGGASTAASSAGAGSGGGAGASGGAGSAGGRGGGASNAAGSAGGGWSGAGASARTLRGVAAESPWPHTGQAPRPWLARTRSPTAICCSRVAWFAVGANSPPPCAAQVPCENCSPPRYPLPVLMPQLPPDSQPATRSHSPSVAADAWPASAMPPPPITAPVNASLATLMFEVVGLRCRPLIRRRRPLLMRPRGQLSGSGGRGRPATPNPMGTAMASPQGAADGSGPISADQGAPPPHPQVGVSPPIGWSSAL